MRWWNCFSRTFGLLLTYHLLLTQSDGEEPTSPVEVAAADEVEVSGDAAASSGSMSVLDALKGAFYIRASTPQKSHRKRNPQQETNEQVF